MYGQFTSGNWLPELQLCWEFISQVPATGHSWGQLSLSEPQALWIEVCVLKGDQAVITEYVHKAAALFHGNLWFLGESRVWRLPGLWNSEICLKKVERSWASLLFPPKASHTKGPCRVIPSVSTVHCRGCLGVRRQHSQGGEGLGWNPQLQQRLRPAEFCHGIPRVLDSMWDCCPSQTEHTRKL